jgi:hypothetical protein
MIQIILRAVEIEKEKQSGRVRSRIDDLIMSE